MECWSKYRPRYQNYVDANTTRPRAREAIISKINARELVDIYREKHGDRETYSWYQFIENEGVQHRARLDYILIDQASVPYVTLAKVYTLEVMKK